MKVLVTGGTGFLGRYVLEALCSRGIETVLAGRHRPDGYSPAEFIETDLLVEPDFGSLYGSSGATHLIHLAWFVEHGKFWTSDFNPRWAEATVRLVDACCRTGCQGMVLAGTCAEYDWSNGLCREDSTPLRPATPYGISKDAARRRAMALCAQYQIPCAWGRVFLPFGSGESAHRLIPSLLGAFRGRRGPFGINSSHERDFLHASDVAEGFVTLLFSEASGAYNISSGSPVQIGLIAQELARLLGVNPQAVLDLPAPESNEPPQLVGENSKLMSLGWQPRLTLIQSLERSVREALAWSKPDRSELNLGLHGAGPEPPMETMQQATEGTVILDSGHGSEA